MKKTAVITIIAMLALGLTPLFAAEDGAAIFKTKCQACHGPNGDASTAIAKKQGIKAFSSPEVQKMTDEELTQMIAEGGKDKKPTHAFKSKGLTDEQVKALVTFIRSLKK
jgi:mono/diheme cytochrome c family protein